MPLLIGARFDKEFHFHLLKLASSENEVSGSDFVSKRLSDLTDAERRLHSRRTKNVGKVHKDSLRGFWSQVVQTRFVFDRAEVSLQETVKQFRLGPGISGSTSGASNLAHRLWRATLLLLEGLFEVVCAITLVARSALD